MGPPHHGTARACRNFSLRQVPSTNWFEDGGLGFSQVECPCPCPPMWAAMPPAAPLFRMPCRKRRQNAQRRVTYAMSGAEKKGEWGEYPLPSAACT